MSRTLGTSRTTEFKEERQATFVLLTTSQSWEYWLH